MINSSYVADPLPVELIVKLTSAASQFDTLIKGLSSWFTSGFIGGLLAVALHKFPVTFTATRNDTQTMSKGLAGYFGMKYDSVKH